MSKFSKIMLAFLIIFDNSFRFSVLSRQYHCR